MKDKNSKLPNIVVIILISTLFAAMGGKFLGKNTTGIAWFIPLTLSVYLLFQNRFKVVFPLWIWLPWGLVVMFNLLRLNYDNSLQRILMLLCPIIVGCAVSTITFDEKKIDLYIDAIRKFCIALFLVILYKSEILFTLKLPEVTPFAAEVMIGLVIINILTSSYFSGNKKDLYYILGLTAIPFIAVTRMAMVATAICIPGTFMNISLKKRVLLFATFGFLGLLAMNSERVQTKMFYSNQQGRFQKQDMVGLFFSEGLNFFDVVKNNPQFATSGRSFMWDAVQRNAESNPWIGKGMGSCEAFVHRITYGSAKYPHNDWLLTYYDLGLIGLASLIISLSVGMLHSLYYGIKAKGNLKILFLGMSFSFIPFCLMMITDNILVYASFFGNFQFCTLAIAYSAHKNQIKQEKASTSNKKNTLNAI